MSERSKRRSVFVVPVAAQGLVETWQPAADIYRTLSGWLLKFELAGVTRDDVAIAVCGPRLTVAGLVLMRQRPGTAKGTIFMTIEDETGSANVIVWPKIFERQRAEVLGARLVAVHGEAQEEQGVLHLIARKVEDITPSLRLIERAKAATPRARNFH